MIHRSKLLVVLLVCLFSGLLNAETTQQTNPNRIQGKVTEILNAAGYTYAKVNTGQKIVWAAAPTTPLKVGDMVTFTTEMPMKNFRSKALDRNFAILYFVNQFTNGKDTPAAPAAKKVSPHANIVQKSVTKPIKGIKKVKGGQTIKEIYANKNKLNGKTIRVRGKVTKYTPSIMKKNWLHIQDSSTLQDLTITSKSTVAINDIVIIEGKLGLDKDFGYGYIYPVIVQDARITKQ